MTPFDDFDELTSSEHYQQVPDDWSVVVTDVCNSTDVIRGGRYRDVNLIGASAVALAADVAGSLEFPFTFGGDGATLVLPPEDLQELKPRLSGLRRLARDQFDLELRVGAVPVHDLSASDVKLEVARYRMSGGVCVGVFRGSGRGEAEKKIRRYEERYGIRSADPPAVNLNGLSCRWKPIPCKHDTVLSVLIQARTDDKQQVYKGVLQRLNSIFDGDLGTANPVNDPGLSYRSIKACMKDEKRYVGQWNFSFLYRMFEIILAVAVFRWGVPLIDSERYRSSLPKHSDFRKFDGMLEATLDCTTEQQEEVTEFLDTLYRRGQIFYGVHSSEEALMTCFVEHVGDGGHLHFIDGGAGGYTMAAVQLKKQLRRHKPEKW